MPAGALRALLFTAFILCLLSLPVINVQAQEESVEQAAEEGPADSVEAPSGGQAEAGEGSSPDVPVRFDWENASTADPANPASVWSMLRVLLTLAVVAAAIYGIVYFFKRAMRGGAAQDPFLKILASTPLGASRSAHIISVGSKAWLVGSAESGVNLIAEIEDKEILDAMVLENSRKSAASGGGRFGDFKAMLRRFGMPPESSPPDPQNIRKRSERLKGL
ncbi:MAG: flagellar biosynthetic protein FliO [Treponema sp.]|nr:flagellar biosynthetic protein FliO [Treponema sp.]